MIVSITLAAGNGTRMKSSIPKPLHMIANRAILDFACDCLDGIKIHKKILIASEDLMKYSLEDKFDSIILQKDKFGTAHAVMCAKKNIKKDDIIIINYGDTPFVKNETIKAMLAKTKKYDCVFLGFDVSDVSKKYGRMQTKGDIITKIIEYKDANEKERNNVFCNSGIVVIKGNVLLKCLEMINNNNVSKEYYLTDIVSIGSKMGYKFSYYLTKESEVMGINSRVELLEAEEHFQRTLRQKNLENGVTLLSKNVYFSYDTIIANDVIIENNVHFGKNVIIHSNVTIKSFSYLEGCKIKSHCNIGPFARIRNGTIIEEYAKIGNFVEIKNANIKQAAKINHLSYIGDAEIGEETNIGAGTITCNYDGYNKHRTKIGKNVLIGSNTCLIAPLKIDDNAIIGAGSVITKSIPKNAISLSRPDQKILNNSAIGYRKNKKLKKKK